jgi:uncharacterized OsmC-like protein
MLTTQTRTINGVDVNQLSGTVDQIRATPGLARFKFQISNQWLQGGHNCSTVKGFHGAMQDIAHAVTFRLDADEPAILLGEDRGANAGEYLLHALAACVTTAMVYHAAARGIQIQEVESEIAGDIDLRGFLGLDKNVRNGFQGIRMAFRIKADVSDAQLEELARLGPQFSPVFDSVTNGVPVTISAARM